MTGLPFTKMHGLGNDYVYVDARHLTIDDPPGLARVVSDRHCGIGADGLILILTPDPPDAADVRMRMFNADGSEAEMCGNGIRCVAKFVRDRQISIKRPIDVQTGAGVLRLDYTLGDDERVATVTVDMGPYVVTPADIPLDAPDPAVDVAWSELLPDVPVEPWATAAGLASGITAVAVGNPHAVFYVERLDGVPLADLGPRIEKHPRFPRGVNVHAVRIDGPGEVTMRTWERGSGLTRACGTGASAVCAVGVLTGRTAPSLLAHLPGGDLQLKAAEGRIEMTGPATEVYTGVWPQ